ncbi:glycosyltransferase [Nitrosopumilus sp. K4]|uniref:glycosyltransferase family 4 protein n=1 Tax=Nitrosopumilus sp. K4 TaxID=2795383 RepID=UPI001BA62704|nr:glycosyltransferase family 4 protein [Nitrosopumilus sp. K4]QUC64790.1 glycosyltransferase [Nitrosopumilus sp. K4]
MKLAYFTPTSPLKTGISEYSEKELLPYLSKHCKIEIIIDKEYTPTNEFIKNNFNIINIEEFKNNYDKILYHVGNNPFHKYVYETAIENPGIVVMHDPLIHHLVRFLTVGQKKPERYIQLMEFAYGPKGRVIAENAITSREFPLFEYPLVKELVESSLAVIVHSKFAENIIREECPDANIIKINMPITVENKTEQGLRESLGIPKNHTVISTFGNIGFYKRLNVALKAFSHFLKKNPESTFIIAGSYLSEAYADEIHKLVEELGITDRVIETGFVEDLQPYISITDIAIQLRYPTAGETSIITLQIMGNGKPVIVSNIGSFEEIPNNTVIKIIPDVKEEVSVYNALLKLANEDEYRKEISDNAEKYIIENHNPENIASEFFEVIKNSPNQILKKVILPEIRTRDTIKANTPVKESHLKETHLKESTLKKINSKADHEINDDDANMINLNLKNVDSGNSLIKTIRKKLHNEMKDWLLLPFQKKQTRFNRKLIQNVNTIKKQSQDVSQNIKTIKKDTEVNFDRIKKDTEVNFDRIKKDTEVNFDRIKKDTEVNFDRIKKDITEIKNDTKKIIETSIKQDTDLEKLINFNLDRRIDMIIERKMEDFKNEIKIEQEIDSRFRGKLNRSPTKEEIIVYRNKIKKNQITFTELENEIGKLE